MRYKNSIKIIIDKRKLDTLLRLNCPINILTSLIFENKLELTGDYLIDDNLESLLEIKNFNNWGGSREGSGRPLKNQLENQLENQDENQLDNQDENQNINQVGDKDKDIDTINSISNITNSSNTITNRFIKPTIEDIKKYCQERNNSVDAEYFYNHYEANGWMVGKNKMKSWKSAVITWEKKQKEFNKTQKDDIPEWKKRGGLF